MKKNYTYFLLMLVAILPMNAQTDINFDVTSTDGTGWIGFMNVSNLPAPFGDGAYQFGGGWGTPDLVAISDAGANTVTLKPNRIGDADPYWQTGNLSGNKIMDASFYLENDALAGTAFTFNGEVISNTINSTGLDVPITYQAFIKIYAADYSSFTAFTSDLSVGNFTISVDASDSAPGNHVQYGFTMVGPNIGLDPSFDAGYDGIGSIVIGENTALSIAENSVSQLSVYPNPSQLEWNIKSKNAITSVQLYDVLGKQVLNVNQNSTDIKIDNSALSKGIYIARVNDGSKTSTIKLIKN